LLIKVRDARRPETQPDRAEGESPQVPSPGWDCVWRAAVDASGRWVYLSLPPAIETLTGRPAGHFLAGVERWWAVIHPDDQPRWVSAVSKLRSGQAAQIEYRLIRADRTICRVRETIRARWENGEARLLLEGIITVLAAGRIAEPPAALPADRFRAFLEASPFLAFITERDGSLLYLNKPIPDLTLNDPAGSPVRQRWERYSQRIMQALRATPPAAFVGSQPAGVIELPVVADGAPRRCLVLKFPFEDSSGENLVGGLVLDVAGQRGPDEPHTPPASRAQRLPRGIGED
jgi:PAS domain-containing protein